MVDSTKDLLVIHHHSFLVHQVDIQNGLYHLQCIAPPRPQ